MGSFVILVSKSVCRGKFNCHFIVAKSLHIIERILCLFVYKFTMKIMLVNRSFCSLENAVKKKSRNKVLRDNNFNIERTTGLAKNESYLLISITKIFKSQCKTACTN